MRSLFIICLTIFGVSLGILSPVEALAQKRKEKSWAFIPPERPSIPQVKNENWVKNPIDAFILARLEKEGLSPSPQANRETLIRRLTFDLTGLPPTPKEIADFVNDTSPEAYEKVVDRLLASPRYGERWAMYWLDLVRYAETDGFNADDLRPTAWRYRDYVIKSFNNDVPYDRFIQEQIAGDELFPDSSDAIVGTAFNRHFPDEYNARNVDQRRQEILNDITDVTAQVFLGLTVGCAKCHDHKYDPITQKDYYQFQAFFAAFSPQDKMVLGDGPQMKEYRQKLANWEAKTATIREKMAELEEPYRKRLGRGSKNKFLKKFQIAYDTPFAQRTPFQKQIADMVAKQVDVDRSKVLKAMKKEDKQKWDELNKELKKFDHLKPPTLPVSMGMTDIGPEAPPTYLLKRGNFKTPGEEVQPAFLSIIDEEPVPLPELDPGDKTTKRRSVLAKWLSSPDNPLTTRVMVNRLWHHHFGRGIVGTPSDFGFQGYPPTHPDLLDWLATEFVAKGWSLKAMHRMMVMSNTYRQASVNHPEGLKVDPDNELFWRMNRQRLEGEALRDAMLFVSGKLNLKMGGPSVSPSLPKEVAIPRGGWKTTRNKAEHYRRSVYIFIKRNLRYPFFKVFDAPDSNETCAARHVSTNAPQALTLLNGAFTLEMAKSFAARTLKETSGQPDAVVDFVFREALGRTPDAKEKELSLQFLQTQGDILSKKLKQKQKVALPPDVPTDVEPVQAAAVVEYCHVVFNLNEFIYID